MRGRKATATIVASPVLVGAVTTLVTIIAVFIAYNANSGLPFVPTYDVSAEVPNGAKLVEGNEVRLGGFRVGVVETIETERQDGKSIAVLGMKLDKVVEPLPIDTSIAVRPRSALGLKYVEITKGASDEMLAAGDTLPLGTGISDTSPPEDLEDVLATFDAETREASRVGLSGLGDALAGRGASINEAIFSLNPLFQFLQPVAENLSDPATELRNLFPGLGRAAAEAAPVAVQQAQLFGEMADTFEAFSRNPDALRDTIAEGPATQAVSIASFRVQRPFLADFADLSARLRPAAQELPRSLPPLNSALRVGTPVLRRVPRLTADLAGLFGSLEDFGRNPNTTQAIRQLDQTVTVAGPGVRFIAPYQTVCNYASYFLVPLGTHISQPGGGGTTQRVLLKMANRTQPNALTQRGASRPVDTPTSKQPGSNPPAAIHLPAPAPAIDGQGRAKCEPGQQGYIGGRFAANARYGPNEVGGRNVVLDANVPGILGGTFNSLERDVDSLEDLD